MMTKTKWRIFKTDGTPVTWCSFCGANVGDISERTNELTTIPVRASEALTGIADPTSYSALRINRYDPKNPKLWFTSTPDKSPSQPSTELASV
jgi:hypothetical protein